jgi:integrase
MSPATVGKCFSILRAILRAAMRARLIALDPTEGATAPSTYQARPTTATISPALFHSALLPAVPVEHRALVCTPAGAGLRWGECAGLPWGAVDLDKAQLWVTQVAVETSSTVTIRAYPKSRAGVRMVPLPPFLVAALRERQALTVPDGKPHPRALVFGTRNGTPLRRSNFRRQIWRPALVRAGLLGKVIEVAPERWQAVWPDDEGAERSAEFASEREATAHMALHAAGGLRFHDLRHSYATWLVTAGTPINDVQAAMGHEQASTTLNRYTHRQDDYDRRILAAFSDPADFSPTETGITDSADDAGDDSDAV